MERVVIRATKRVGVLVWVSAAARAMAMVVARMATIEAVMVRARTAAIEAGDVMVIPRAGARAWKREAAKEKEKRRLAMGKLLATMAGTSEVLAM